MDRIISVVFCESCQRLVLSFFSVHLFYPSWVPDHNGISLWINTQTFASKTGGEISSSSTITLASEKWFENWFGSFIMESYINLCYTVSVLDSHTSSGHWHTTLCSFANIDSDSVEMAKNGLDWITFCGCFQHRRSILCDNCSSTLKLCIFWGIVSDFHSKTRKFNLHINHWHIFDFTVSNNSSEQPI